MTGATSVVDLSIDFDFWVREDSAWDFGHDETDEVFAQFAWLSRYGGMFDLFKETDPKRFADFLPKDLMEALVSRRMVPQLYGDGQFGYSDSHRFAYQFFAGCWQVQGPPDRLIQLDAHHDSFQTGRSRQKEKRLNCGNWLSFLMDDYPTVPVRQVYPKWKDPKEDGPPEKKIEIVKWSDLRRGDAAPLASIRNVFLCRSGVWVPPHFDKDFWRVASTIATAYKEDNQHCLQPLLKRHAPTRKAAAIQRKHLRERMEALRKQVEVHS